jgi:hypothetical protein
MPDAPKREPPPKLRTEPPPRPDGAESPEEVLREQAKTETERCPYLDTEGGE